MQEESQQSSSLNKHSIVEINKMITTKDEIENEYLPQFSSNIQPSEASNQTHSSQIYESESNGVKFDLGDHEDGGEEDENREDQDTSESDDEEEEVSEICHDVPLTETCKENGTENNKKRKKADHSNSQTDSKEQSKKPKKYKNQFQRRNIKKIKTDNQLNESTLKALKEEQERQMRLNQQNNRFDLNTNYQEQSFNYVQLEPKQEPLIELDSSEGALSKSSDHSICIISDDDTNFTESKREPKKSQSNETTEKAWQPERIKLENYQNVTSSFTNQNISTIEDDDDCRILTESEHLQDEMCKKKYRGLHMNDELNVPDANGQVLVNVNHPPEDQDVYLLPFLAKNIKTHQIGGIRFIYDNIIESLGRVKNKNTGFGCILAHAMGLGKTFQTISFIEIFLRCTESSRVLCIVPINTIQNWMNEFNFWLPEDGQQTLDQETVINYRRPFKVFLINDFLKNFKQRAEVILEWKNKGGVLLIGYEMFRTLLSSAQSAQKQQNKFKRSNASKQNTTEVIDLEEEDELVNKQSQVEEALVTACLVVCDEGHRIKNSSANIAKTLQKIQTKRRIVLTGYPLQNNLIEYWCMVDFVRPSYLGTKSEFTNMFERPIMNGQCMDSTKEDVKLMRFRAHVLHSLLEGFVQRRGHDVFICSLPKKYEFIVSVKLSPIQKQLYIEFIRSIGAMNPNEKTNPLRSFAICCKIWNHPDVFYNFYTNKESEIDLDLPDLPATSNNSNLNSKNTKKQAKSNYIPTKYSSFVQMEDGGLNPFAAADRYRSNTNGLDLNWASFILDSYRPNVLENGAKIMIAFTLIEQSILQGDKILLFSQSLLSLNLIEEFLKQMHVPNTNNKKWEKNKSYYRLDGSTPGSERERLINSFNKPNNGAWLFLISTRAGCLGINLVGANRVIVLDASWNPCHDAQAVCRVYRYGQTKNCFIYRLIADHSMEKKIYDRQISKQTMSDRVIDEIQAENHFSRSEVEKLLHFVQEDVEPADLTELASKFNDPVLINSCLRHSHVITKEPFTHESLLIDKKEYQLSEREKAMAFREYQHDKKYFPYTRSNSAFGYQRFPSNHQQLAQNQLDYSNHLNKYSASLTNSSLASLASTATMSYSASPYSNLKATSSSLDFHLNTNIYSSSPPFHNMNAERIAATNQSQSVYNETINNGQIANKSFNNVANVEQMANNCSISSSFQSFMMNNTNSQSAVSMNVSPTQPQNGLTESQIHSLRDVKISSFVAPSQIVIPADQQIVIQPGEKVFILKTSKGCYLRTQDKKYIALRNKSSIEGSSSDQASLSSTTNSEMANSSLPMSNHAANSDIHTANSFADQFYSDLANNSTSYLNNMSETSNYYSQKPNNFTNQNELNCSNNVNFTPMANSSNDAGLNLYADLSLNFSGEKFQSPI